MTPEEFKKRWDSDESGGGITNNDVAECAINWGLCQNPYTYSINEIIRLVTKYANTNEWKKETNKNIEFLEEEHIYLVSGIIVPSVTQILETIFPDKYKGIPSVILNNKATYGSIVHKSIECIEQDLTMPELDENQQKSLNDYLEIKKENNIEVISQEQRVAYKDIYAGTYDMVANVNDELSLLDIKTTAKLDLEYLSYQLSYYEMAIGKRFKNLYAIWLPKGSKGKLVKVKRKAKKELIKRLDDYEKF